MKIDLNQEMWKNPDEVRKTYVFTLYIIFMLFGTAIVFPNNILFSVIYGAMMLYSLLGILSHNSRKD